MTATTQGPFLRDDARGDATPGRARTPWLIRRRCDEVGRDA